MSVSRADGGGVLGAVAILRLGAGVSKDAELGAVELRPLVTGGIGFVSGNASADANDADDGVPIFPLSPFVVALAGVPLPLIADGKFKSRVLWFVPVLPI